MSPKNRIRPLRVTFNLIKEDESFESSETDVAFLDNSSKQFIQDNWHCESWPIVAAISDSYYPFDAQRPHGNTFITLKTYSDSDPDTKTPRESVDLNVSWKTIRCHNLQVDRKHFLYYVHSPIPLDELVIGTTLPLEEASNKFCELIKSRNPLLIRQGDHTLGQDCMLSLSCCPVRQGIFSTGTTKTTFVPISPEDEAKILAESRKLPDHRKIVTSTEAPVGSNEFKILLLHKQHVTGAQRDEDCIFLTKSACFRLRVKPNEWYNVKITSSSGDDHWRPAQVQHCSLSQADDSVTISPILFHNLLNLQTSSIAACQLKKCTLSIDTSPLPIEISKLTDSNFLRSIHVALIPSPGYPGTIEVDNLLKSYLSSPRLVMKHDVLAIHSLVWPCVNNQISTLNFPIIYFKVTKLEGTGLFVLKDHSNLYHTGNMHSLVPPLDESYFDTSELTGAFTCIPSRINCFDSFLALLEPYLSNQLSEPAVVSLTGTGALAVIEQTARVTHRQIYSIDLNTILMDTPSATETRLRSALAKISIYAPCLTVLHNFDLLCMEEKGNDERYVELIQETLKVSSEQSAPFPVICIAHLSSDEVLATNPSYGMLFLHRVTLPDLTVDERKIYLQNITSHVDLHLSVDLKDIAKSTNGFTLDHLDGLIAKSLENRSRRLAHYNSLCHTLAGFLLLPEDINSALHEITLKFKKIIGAPEIPSVKWSDIGGLDHVRDEIMDMIQLPLEFPDLFVKSGLKRGGILLHGPPGTGKTLIAKAVATECDINFLSVKGPELINMYIGQSEENVRNVFATARASAPCVVFFDELDSLAPNRGQSGDSGGVMDRVVSQLLSEMDGVGRGNNVFLIGATNRVDLIDPAMLRPGRFDKVVYIGVPETREARIQVLRALTRKFSSADQLDYEFIESHCPSNYSGAEFYALCSAAMKFALRRCVRAIDEGTLSEPDAEVTVTMEDFKTALNIESNVKEE